MILLLMVIFSSSCVSSSVANENQTVEGRAAFHWRNYQTFWIEVCDIKKINVEQFKGIEEKCISAKVKSKDSWPFFTEMWTTCRKAVPLKEPCKKEENLEFSKCIWKVIDDKKQDIQKEMQSPNKDSIKAFVSLIMTCLKSEAEAIPFNVSTPAE